MKKSIFLVVIALIVLAVPTLAFAVGDTQGTNVDRPSFVDADDNGVCDSYADRPMDGTGKRYMRSQNGTPMGMGMGFGENFVDNNSDGVCDNYENRPQDGTGRGAGNCGGVCGINR